MTLRARLLWGLLLVLTTLGVSGFVVAYVQRDYLTSQLDRQLTAITPRAGFVIARLAGHGGVPAGPPAELVEIYVGVIDSSGRLETLQAPATDPGLVPDVSQPEALAAPATRSTTAGRSAEVRIVAVTLADGSTAVFAVPTARADDAFRRLMITLAGAAVLVMAVVALVVWWVIRLGLRPIRQMTDAADAISAGAADRRVDVPPGRTEAARLGLALNTMLDTSQAADARLRRFVADASHELRTPLTTLRGYTALHASGGLADDASIEDAMRRMNDEATRMGRIVDDLLQLADIDEHGTPHPEPVELGELVRGLASDLQVVAPGRRVTVDTSPSIVVLGDRDLLTQAIAAFTANALRHTPETTPIEIHIRLGDTADTARVEVVDHGPGIAAEHLPCIFDRFYRVDNGRSSRSGGNGLGLAIVASIASAHGGKSGVESQLGSGSTFWIELPLAPEPNVA